MVTAWPACWEQSGTGAKLSAADTGTEQFGPETHNRTLLEQTWSFRLGEDGVRGRQPEMEFLDINLTKDKNLLLYAIHSPSLLRADFKETHTPQKKLSLFMSSSLQNRKMRLENQTQTAKTRVLEDSSYTPRNLDLKCRSRPADHASRGTVVRQCLRRSLPTS